MDEVWESLPAVWLLTEAALPSGYFISNLRHRHPRARWCASATLDGDIKGANYSGFGPTPTDALLDLAANVRRHQTAANG